MSITHKITRRYETDGELIEQTKVTTVDGEDNRDVSVPDETTDHQINIAIDVSLLKSFYLDSDQDVTVESNSGSAPDDTFTLKANSPLIWDENDGQPNPFVSAVDVTKLFVTNTGNSAAAAVRIRVGQDSTP